MKITDCGREIHRHTQVNLIHNSQRCRRLPEYPGVSQCKKNHTKTTNDLICMVGLVKLKLTKKKGKGFRWNCDFLSFTFPRFA